MKIRKSCSQGFKSGLWGSWLVFTGGQISPLGKWAAETCHVVVAQGNDIFPICSIITLQLSIIESAKHFYWCQSVLRCSETPGLGTPTPTLPPTPPPSPLFHVSRSHMGSFHFVKLRSLSLSQLTCPSHSHPVLYLGSELVVAQLPTCALPGIDC